MIETDLKLYKPESSHVIPLSFPLSFFQIYEKLQKWMTRYPQSLDNSIFNELYLFYLTATRKYLDHRNPTHLFRLLLTTHLMNKKLQREATFFPNQRHMQIRWISTTLRFPFSTKRVLSFVIGFNVLNKYELFDEENIILALQKQFPELRLVKDCVFHPIHQNKNLKFFYFEIEKKDGSFFTLSEKFQLKNNMADRVKNSIQKLSPAIFMGYNEEETYRNILTLSQEIQFLHDLPQACINLDQKTGSEIIFRITLVYISPFHRFSLAECFLNGKFVSERVLTVRHLENHPIEAHIFRLHLPRSASFIRADGSLDFYAARQKIANLIHSAIGEFRDYNGGIIIKQQELLQSFREGVMNLVPQDPEMIEIFFYSLIPIEKQAILVPEILINLFSLYLENRETDFNPNFLYSFKVYHQDPQIYLIIHCPNPHIKKTINAFIDQHPISQQNMAYNLFEEDLGVFFCCVFIQANESINKFLDELQLSLEQWQKHMNVKKTLKIALGCPINSLDPRIGGDTLNGDFLRILFEGLTRLGPNGIIENALAESIDLSDDHLEYTFHLRESLWNDGSRVTAYDFEYAWKKILSPNFITPFAYLFYPIKNAKEAKEGRVSLDLVGIQVMNDHLLKVTLTHPTPYFLELTAQPFYSPVHRVIDQLYPQWPYQSDKNYPCNGPFQPKINQPNEGYQLVKNPNYWKSDEIALEQISLTPMNTAHAIQAFQNKEVDWVGAPFGLWDSFHQIEKYPNKVTFPNMIRVCWLVFNTKTAPFNHRKLRHAFAYAINKARIISNSYMPLKPAYSSLPPHYFKDQNKLFPEADLERAQQLLKESLEELNLEKIPPITLIYHEKGIQSSTAQELKKQFKDLLGIDCELNPVCWDEQFEKMTSGNYQIGLMHWASWVDDPIYTLNSFVSAEEETNFSKWEHPEYQEYIYQSHHTVDPHQRLSYLFKAEKLLSEEMPIVPLFYNADYQALLTHNLNIPNPTSCGYFDIARSFFK